MLIFCFLLKASSSSLKQSEVAQKAWKGGRGSRVFGSGEHLLLAGGVYPGLVVVHSCCFS